MRTVIILGACLVVLGAFYVHGENAQQSGDVRKELDELGKLASKSLPDRARRWRCDAATKFSCSIKGCEKVRDTGWVNLDFLAGRYERCDSKGCDQYEMTHSLGGIYTTVSAGQGTFLKAVNDGSEFTDIVSLGTSIFASFGRCTPHS